LDRFEPELIILSAGFDGHRDDPTNGLRLAEEDYYVITKQLKRVAQRYCNVNGLLCWKNVLTINAYL
jgi:acetoin utilization deacetylase AcuC-like enzyme